MIRIPVLLPRFGGWPRGGGASGCVTGGAVGALVNTLRSSAMPLKLVVEYAKSGRSACKKCGGVISKGNVRVGSVSKGGAGHLVTLWYHANCTTTAQLGLDATAVESMGGFQLLKAVDQKAVRDLLKPVEGSESLEQSTEVFVDKKWEAMLNSFNPSKLTRYYRDASLPKGWKAFATVIIGQVDGLKASKKIAAFDFDGCLVRTSVSRHGADAWSLLYSSIPEKMESYHNDGFKLVVFTNESNIDRWVRSRQKAIDSKVGRLDGFRKTVRAPILVFISCGVSSDPCRKPAPGMWQLMERHFNDGIEIDRESSFYVGDAAGRPGDHSDADSGFAKAAGVRFLVPEDMFLTPPPPRASMVPQAAAHLEVFEDTVYEKRSVIVEASSSLCHKEAVCVSVSAETHPESLLKDRS